MNTPDFRTLRLALHCGTGQLPVLGFGTLIADPVETLRATGDALQAGFRHIDCAERYRNEREAGAALRLALASGRIGREELFITTKLWNTNHRAERVQRAFSAHSARAWSGSGSNTSTCT